MVVMKFLNPAAAAEFAEEYNGKPFNSMEVSSFLKPGNSMYMSDGVLAGNLPHSTCPFSGH